MMATANKNKAEEQLSNLDADQEKAETALKTASKGTRKKTVIAAKKTGKTTGVAMEKTSKKTTDETSTDATTLAKVASKNINETAGEKHGKTIGERPAKAIGERPDKAAGKTDGESANKATGKRPDKATKLLKDAILKAAIKAGNQLGEDGLVSYLEAQALKNASSFLTLLGNVLPAELNNNGQGIKTDGQTK